MKFSKLSVLISLFLSLNIIGSLNAVEVSNKTSIDSAKESMSKFSQSFKSTASQTMDFASKKANEFGTSFREQASNAMNFGSKKAKELSAICKDKGSSLIEEGSKKATEYSQKLSAVDWSQKLNNFKNTINSNLNKLGKTTLSEALPYATMATGALLTVYALYNKMSYRSMETDVDQFIKENTSKDGSNVVYAQEGNKPNVVINKAKLDQLLKNEAKCNTINSLLIGVSGAALAGLGYIYR